MIKINADQCCENLFISDEIIIERIMSTHAICLSSESNASMLTAVNLNMIK